MTILHPDSVTLTEYPDDPITRYHGISLLAGLWVILITGDYVVEGRLVNVEQPDMASDDPCPVVTLDTVDGPLTGNVLPGDMIVAPLR
jgi:hypothetical protein